MTVHTPTLPSKLPRPTPTSLVTALSAALLHGNAPLAVQLAWRLIFQPACPLRLQAHAVLVHSALSLRLGGRPRLIEGNLRAIIHRLAGGTELARLAARGHLAPWKLEALAQLHAALRSLRLHGEIPFRVQVMPQTPPSPQYKPVLEGREPEHLVEGMGKMELDGKMEMEVERDLGSVVVKQEESSC